MSIGGTNKSKGISVIICCYNSANRLPATLGYLAAQKVQASIEWEVIVVNNNSADNTSRVAIGEWDELGSKVPLIVVEEKQAGLVFARQKGVQTSRFDILVFCDDDNWLSEDYLSQAHGIMSSNANIGILGGRSEGCFEGEKPSWFEKFHDAYAVGKQLPASGIANKRTYVAGAGMVVRKAVFEELRKNSFQSLLTGRKGKKLSSGEDCELCLMAMFLGYDLYYDERLQFTHFITAKRLTWKYCLKMISRGHSVPQIYFEFYRYCYKKIMDNEEALFAEIFAKTRTCLLKKIACKMFQSRPFWLPFKLVIKSEPGSRKEIELKATIHECIYLLANKRSLKRQFCAITGFLQNIKQAKIHGSSVVERYQPFP